MMDRLNTCLEQWNIRLSDDMVLKFRDYYALLREWNSFMNLTAIIEEDEVIDKHFVDSLALGHYMELKDQSLLDLGTGAGFPGIPLKIVYPGLRITLADSQQKRLRFLDTVIRELALDQITTVHGRAEDLANDPNYREQFDLCASRAVANLTTLSEYCLPFVKTGGTFVPYKAEKTEEELTQAGYAISVLGGSLDRVESYMLPGSDLNRTLLFIRKIKKTPGKYPRKAGSPSKEPLVKRG